MFKVFLINFGYSIYEGEDLEEAQRIAIDSGFESVIYDEDEIIMTYSPINGLKKK